MGSWEFWDAWVEYTLKFAGIFGLIGAAILFFEPPVQINKVSEFSIISFDKVLEGIGHDLASIDENRNKELSSGTLIAQTFYDRLNQNKPFNQIAAPSYVDQKKALSDCEEEVKHTSKISSSTIEESQAIRERFAKTIAGFSPRQTPPVDQCAHYLYWELTGLLMQKYGVPFDFFPTGQVKALVHYDRIKEVIETFNSVLMRTIIYERLGDERKVLTSLRVENPSRMDARNVRVRFNFSENTTTKIGSGVSFGGLFSWEIVERAIKSQGGRIEETGSYSPEVTFDLVPAGASKFIYVMTQKYSLIPDAYVLELPVYNYEKPIGLAKIATIMIIMLSFWRAYKKTNKPKKLPRDQVSGDNELP